jgi:hypothetical protein
VRQSVVLLLLSLAGMLLGGWLVGVWCFGVVLIALSGGAIVWALFHDDGKAPAEWQPQVYAFGPPDPDVRKFMDRVRGAA